MGARNTVAGISPALLPGLVHPFPLPSSEGDRRHTEELTKQACSLPLSVAASTTLKQVHNSSERPDEETALGRPGPQQLSMTSHQEALTNLSPVTGSILLSVSRSRMESNGTFRKNTLERERPR